MDITTKFKISFVFLSVDELPSWTVKLYLPEAAGYISPVFHLCLFSGLELHLEYLRHMLRNHFIDTNMHILLSDAFSD